MPPLSSLYTIHSLSFTVNTYVVIVFSMPFFTPFSCFFNLSLKGIDSWVKLHARMVVMLPKFNDTTIACRKIFKSVFYAYKEDKMANGISSNDRMKANSMML